MTKYLDDSTKNHPALQAQKGVVKTQILDHLYSGEPAVMDQPTSPLPSYRDELAIMDQPTSPLSAYSDELAVMDQPTSPLPSYRDEPVVMNQPTAPLVALAKMYPLPLLAEQSTRGPAAFAEAQALLAVREQSSVTHQVVTHVHAPLTEATRLLPLVSTTGVQQKFLRIVQAWLYRIALLVATGSIMWALFAIQGSLNAAILYPSSWQTTTRWIELVWIISLPVAFIFWLGWLVFAQFVQPDPPAIDVPVVAPPSHLDVPQHARLLFRLITRGDNLEVLQQSVSAIYEAFSTYSALSGLYSIEVVSDLPIVLPQSLMSNTTIFVVPTDYVTIHKSRYKARAMAYLQEQTTPRWQDWHIYLDEESVIDDVFVAGIYQFIIQASARLQRYRHKPAGMIGQGTIIYQGGHWFFRAADAMRTGDDLGRFRLQYGLGLPLFGMHGSFIVVRGIDDARLSFDVGPGNSIAEDAAWALRAWFKGYRFGWVNGYLYEQPPQTLSDFVKQRSRWLIGIRGVLRDRVVPLRYRFCLGIFTYSWHLSLIPTLIAVLALFTHTNAFPWVQFPANFSWAVFFLAYLQGMLKQVERSSLLLHRRKAPFFRLLLQRILVFPLALGVFWYTLLESYSIFYSCLRSNQGFFVIRKPQLTTQKATVNK